jgi:hypothetical protein
VREWEAGAATHFIKNSQTATLISDSH